jgi:Tfp pilus assembly protein PilW
MQADGRVALDALSRDARAAGDYGCWPVANPIDGRLNAVAYDLSKGGIRGYTTGANGTLAASDLVGAELVRNANPEQVAVAFTGISGVLTTTAADMANETADLTVARSPESFKAGDVAVVTDCITWAKFQVTSVVPDGQDQTKIKLGHAGGAMSVYGGGNKSGALGAAFKRDSTVGSLDTVWWFLGTVDGVRGLYRLSARNGTPVLVSSKVYAMEWSFVTSSEVNGKTEIKPLSPVGATDSDWLAVRKSTLQLLMRSEKPSNAAGKLELDSFAGVKIPSDRRLYLPLQVNVALRNQ